MPLMELEHLPFSGDERLAERMAALIRETQPACIVETGTYRGVTTGWLAQQGRPVHSIEIRGTFADDAFRRLAAAPNATVHRGSSPDVLRRLIPKWPRPILFFLDAHWGADWPLLAELAAIAGHHRADSIIVIHDFKVPDSTLGFDVYGGQELDWDYVRSGIERIYGVDGFTREHNSEATGARRGVLIVRPRSAVGATEQHHHGGV